MIRHSKQAGIQTSIITNGTVFAKIGLEQYLPWLDMIGISIDSLNASTNEKIGRPHVELPTWIRIADEIRRAGASLKINTVVTRLNWEEDLSQLIIAVKPDRWKILRAIKIDGVNSQNPALWLPDDAQFTAFVSRHEQTKIPSIIENEEDLRGSYVMITPDGRFYDSVEGGYRTSKPILDVGIDAAFEEVQFSMEKFLKRGGRYFIGEAQ